MLCKTVWSWELRTWSHKKYLLDILSTSPHYLCRKWIGATDENTNFDLRVLRVKCCFWISSVYCFCCQLSKSSSVVKATWKAFSQFSRLVCLTLLFFFMVKPPASDHTKCEELVVAYRRWSLTIVQLQEGFSKTDPDSFTYPRENSSFSLDLPLCFLKRIKRTEWENVLHAISRLKYILIDFNPCCS